MAIQLTELEKMVSIISFVPSVLSFYFTFFFFALLSKPRRGFAMWEANSWRTANANNTSELQHCYSPTVIGLLLFKPWAMAEISICEYILFSFFHSSSVSDLSKLGSRWVWSLCWILGTLGTRWKYTVYRTWTRAFTHSFNNIIHLHRAFLCPHLDLHLFISFAAFKPVHTGHGELCTELEIQSKSQLQCNTEGVTKTSDKR